MPVPHMLMSISQPIGPAPMIAMRLGNSVREKRVSLVRYSISSRPSIGGADARAPVAITAFADFPLVLVRTLNCDRFRLGRPDRGSADARVEQSTDGERVVAYELSAKPDARVTTEEPVAGIAVREVALPG